MQRFICGFLALLLVFSGNASALDINGELKKAQFEKLSSSPTGSEARVYWDTTLKKAQIHNGTSWTSVGSGSGASGNLIEGGDAEDSAANPWATYNDGSAAAPVDGTAGSLTDISAAARDTDVGDLIAGDASWRLSKSANDARGEGWSIDLAFPAKSTLFSSLVEISFGYYFSNLDVPADTIRVYVYDDDNDTLITPQFTTCGGGSTPSLTTTTTPCQAELAFVSTTADNYRLIFHVASTDADDVDIFIDDVFVGSKGVQVGPGNTGWISYTPADPSDFTTSARDGFYRRVGDSIDIRVRYTLSSAISGSLSITAAQYLNGLGLTVDTTKHSSSISTVGVWQAVDASAAAAGNNFHGTVMLQSDSSLIFVNDVIGGGDIIDADVPFGWVSTDRLYFQIYGIPISEWAGGTAVGENKVEYASNSGTWDATDTTSFAYGPAGQAFGGTLTAGRTKRVRFQSPIQSTDLVTVEFSEDRVRWAPAGQSSLNNLAVFTESAETTATVRSGVLVDVTGTADANELDVFFGQYMGMSGDRTSALTNWPSSNAYWRVKKVRGGAAIDFGLASSTASGLAPAGTFAAGIDGAVTLQERTATPTDPSSGAEGRLYVKGDKLVIQFNDGGTVRYKYLDLTGTGVTWVHTTSAP